VLGLLRGELKELEGENNKSWGKQTTLQTSEEFQSTWQKAETREISRIEDVRLYLCVVRID